VYDSKKEGKNSGKHNSLLVSAENMGDDFLILNSVRNVENSSNVYIDRRKL
jgi:hypothetical protein